ncbi:MAG: asparagine synthase (glutamine-hydrolyzing) [Oleiphilaceae bacterium]|nr:asparagine synthase (glutamine-hydrolyzing) [Oleiphilaceae bacterium]
MCGFAGFTGTLSGSLADECLRAMGQQLKHRGPDGEGQWQDQTLSIALVHRRLSIQDLSEAGTQPMASNGLRFMLVFNGEIYNFPQLRDELESLGARFRGHSDTEVMLAAFEHWGLHASLSRFVGMFAFALVDRDEGRLYLVRDRLGEKPLYYGWQGQSLLFASELKALKCHPQWQGRIDASVLPLYLRHNLIPAPYSIYQGIRKLPPASIVSFDLRRPTPGILPEPERYWRAEDFIHDSTPIDRESASVKLESLLNQSIAGQRLSDVPLGAFLSGGIDSSTVVALMQKQSERPVRTFSIGFAEEGFNEAQHAREVARYLGTEHHELYVTAEDALAVIPDLASMYDEPFADSSQIPTYLVSRMTREQVTVALSGDGGDELFCGYSRYRDSLMAWQRRRRLSTRARALLTRLPPELAAALIRRLVPSQRHRSSGGIRVRLGVEAALAGAGDLSEFYRRRVSFWADPGQVLSRSQEPPYALNRPLPYGLHSDPLKTLMWRDLHWYLPDDILTKVDRAAMACSLETRIPMLDHRVVEFALSLPTALNNRGGGGKQVLRDLLYRHVPRELVERPKQGFAVPIASWLRGALREWAESLLAPERLEAQGYWRTPVVRWFWQEHLSGREDYSFELWSILMFQSWLDRENLTANGVDPSSSAVAEMPQPGRDGHVSRGAAV